MTDGGLLAGPADLRQPLVGRAGRDLVFRERGEADDRSQQVVEIVGHAAGELADRFHLLCLPQVVLEAAALGDVASDCVHRDRRAVPALHPARQLEDDTTAVLGEDRHLVVRMRRVL